MNRLLYIYCLYTRHRFSVWRKRPGFVELRRCSRCGHEERRDRPWKGAR
jgi:Zn ribbon nucleic-acid-binding protein